MGGAALVLGPFALALAVAAGVTGDFVGGRAAQAASCKSVANCAEAVELWCGGYTRADREGDGVPCENHCRSREQVAQHLNGRSCGRTQGGS